MELQSTLNDQELKRVEAKRCIYCDSVYLKSHNRADSLKKIVNFCESCGRVQQVVSSDSFWNIQTDYYPVGKFLFLHLKLRWGLFWRIRESVEYVERIKKRVKRLLDNLSQEDLELSDRLLFHYELKHIYLELSQTGLLPDETNLIKTFYLNEPAYLRDYRQDFNVPTLKGPLFRLFIFTFSLLFAVYLIFQLFEF